ncbi:response regulator [Colwellia sp. 20A7]|uniref:response regulator n=1 Tax=Colwellia sp. 20A7 TaxID=2689569 RepID=UPI00135C4D07|nr:response regulator [Colwellia sp. 20A7]
MDIKIGMNEHLIQILEDTSFYQFTISELSDAYLKLSGGTCRFVARKFVYKQILRLLKKKLVNKKGDKYSHNAIYLKTCLFGSVKFICKLSKESNNPTNNLVKSTKPYSVTINTESDTLMQYKVEVMSAIGETEEYKRLLKVYPELKAVLTNDYHNAEDKKFKLLGQIKAINTLLSYTNKE